MLLTILAKQTKMIHTMKDEDQLTFRRIIMNDSTIRATTRTCVTPRASLVAIGAEIRKRGILEPLRQRVQIAQKTIRHSPTDKLLDALIGMLAGAQGMVDRKSTLRADLALQRAFGRTTCAEQSTIQDTLDHCTAETV